MVKFRNWHKYAGLISGAVLFILAFTGFFLDHKSWSFLYTTTIPNSYLPATMKEIDSRLVEAYWVDAEKNEVLVGTKRGLFHNSDAEEFSLVLEQQILALRKSGKEGFLYSATDDGIYRSKEGNEWREFALQGLYVNALAVHDKKLIAIVDKTELIVMDAKGSILERTAVHIDPIELQHSISLSRYVRDFHYGRGLFDGIWSLLINDVTAVLMIVLSMSGFMIWWLIRKVRAKQKKYAKSLKPVIKLHGNFFAVIFVVPMVLFSLTGIVLDHSQFFNKYIKGITLPHAILPPIYDSLREDVWSVDYDGKVYRIGNRYGIYKSSDLDNWYFENRGLAYKMERFGGELLVSGMGSPNRIYSEQKGWKIMPKTPHMFKDAWQSVDGYRFFSSHHPNVPLPSFTSTTLYSLLLALHDGTFFASWWVYVNDIASVLLLILLFTGTWRWAKKKKGLLKR